MNASMPMSTINPPFTFRTGRPSMMSPSLWLLMMHSQPFWRSALCFERMTMPCSSSTFSTYTSTSSPTARVWMSLNSALEIEPSDLKPMSTTTSWEVISMMRPFTIWPSVMTRRLCAYRSDSEEEEEVVSSTVDMDAVWDSLWGAAVGSALLRPQLLLQTPPRLRHRLGELFVARAPASPAFRRRLVVGKAGGHRGVSIGHRGAERNPNFRRLKPTRPGGERLEGALDQHGNDGDAGRNGEQADPPLGRPQPDRELAVPLGKDRHPLAPLQPEECGPHRRQVGLAALDRHDPDAAQVAAEERPVEEVGPGEEPEPARAGDAKQRRVEEADVVGGDDEGTARGHMLLAAHLKAVSDAEDEPQDEH